MNVGMVGSPLASAVGEVNMQTPWPYDWGVWF